MNLASPAACGSGSCTFRTRQRKTLTTIAALALVGASGIAFGQTANVTLYGSLRLDFENVRASNATNGASVVSTNRVNSNQSRFGMRGEEALGKGWKAIFQIENGFDASANGANSTNVGGGSASATNTIATYDTW